MTPPSFKGVVKLIDFHFLETEWASGEFSKESTILRLLQKAIKASEGSNHHPLKGNRLSTPKA